MRYQGILKTTRDCEADLVHQPGLPEKMGRLMDQAVREGVLATKDRKIPATIGARVKLLSGQFTITGITFAERNERAVSYGMFYVESLTEAIEWTKCFLKVIGEGECEIQPVGEFAQFPAAC